MLVLEPCHITPCKFFKPVYSIIAFRKLHTSICEYKLIDMLTFFTKAQAHCNTILAARYVSYNHFSHLD